MKNKFSLIMATYGRCEEVGCFLESIQNAKYDLNFVEIIIVDQNDKIQLDKIVNKYKESLNIIYIKSLEKGLALNRNIGLERATGDIIAFPDDDCEYLPDTLEKVNNYLNENSYDIVMGRIVERDGSDSLRAWPKQEIDVTPGNFYTKCSSVTMFLKKASCEITFNSRLGSGQYFGACEDADLLYRNLKNNKRTKYYPELRIYHPHYESGQNMDDDKVYKYGLGFGAFVKSNIDFNTSILFTKAEVYHLLRALGHICTFNLDDSKKRYIAFKSRIIGFIKYK